MNTKIENGSGGSGDGGEVWKWGDPHTRRMGDLLKTGFGSDFDLVLGQEKSKVPVHKIFLQAGSRVLNSNIKKCSGTQLVIEAVDTRIFGLLLKYLYTGKSGASLGDALALLQLATNYEVDELRDQCATLLKSDLTQENVLPLFQGAMEYAHKELIQSTLKYICREGRQILKRKDFTALRLECLIEIIQQDKLRVKDEMAVFEAVYQWGEAESVRKGVDGSDMKELRRVLDKPLKYIRFPLMDKEEFALKVGNKNILDMSELTTLLMCFLVSPERRNVLPSGRFSSTPRTYYAPSVPTVYSRWPLDTGACRQKSGTTALHLTETLMIRINNEEDDVILSSLSIWKSIFDIHSTSYANHYDAIRATVTIKCDRQLTLFEAKYQVPTLIVNDDLLEVKFAKAFTFPKNKKWVELNLVISGSVGYSHRGGLYSTNTTPLTTCVTVNNYGRQFLEQQRASRFEGLGVEFKRKGLDMTPMTQGLIEKLTFGTL